MTELMELEQQLAIPRNPTISKAIMMRLIETQLIKNKGEWPVGFVILGVNPKYGRWILNEVEEKIQEMRQVAKEAKAEADARLRVLITEKTEADEKTAETTEMVEARMAAEEKARMYEFLSQLSYYDFSVPSSITPLRRSTIQNVLLVLNEEQTSNNEALEEIVRILKRQNINDVVAILVETPDSTSGTTPFASVSTSQGFDAVVMTMAPKIPRVRVRQNMRLMMRSKRNRSSVR